MIKLTDKELSDRFSCFNNFFPFEIVQREIFEEAIVNHFYVFKMVKELDGFMMCKLVEVIYNDEEGRETIRLFVEDSGSVYGVYFYDPEDYNLYNIYSLRSYVYGGDASGLMYE